MGLRRLGPGHIPYEINVVIEIPAHSEPVKYEVDKDTFTLFVDRFMGTTMRYPCNYGYIPQTLSEDDDPVDVLVVAPFSVISGSVIRSRPIGILEMVDEAGPDSKILAVPVHDLTSLYELVKEPEDLSPMVLSTIQHFFRHYKDLEVDKWVEVKGWLGPEAAEKEILEAVKRYQEYLSKEGNS